MSWTAVGGASSYSFFCVASGGTCSGAPVGTGGSSPAGATTATVTGLAPNSQYECFVRSINACSTPCSSGATGRTACSAFPSAPGAVTVSASTTGRLTLRWPENVPSVASYAGKCVVKTGTETCGSPSVGTWSPGACLAGTCSGDVTGLSDGVQYTCYVTAIDAGGCESGCSAGATDTPCSGPPLGAAAPTITSSTPTALLLSWTAVPGTLNYDYYCMAQGSGACPVGAGATVGTGGANVATTLGVVSAVPNPNTPLDCYVVARNSCGTSCVGQTAGSTACPPTPPTAPTTPTVSGGTTSGTLTVYWTDTSASSYSAFCVATSTPVAGTETCADPTQFASSPPVVAVGTACTAGTCSADVGGMADGTQYTCYVVALDANGCKSSCSPGASAYASTPLPPIVPFVAAATCEDSNSSPTAEDPSAAPVAMYVLHSLKKWNKVGFDSDNLKKLTYMNALWDSIGGQGISGARAHIFNTDNSALGVGVHTRIWFQTQADCVAYANYVHAITRNTPGTPTDDNMPTSEFPSGTFGDVRIRHVTNPNSRCFRWKFAEAYLLYNQNGWTSPPTLATNPADTLPAAVPACAPDDAPTDMVPVTPTSPQAGVDNLGMDMVFSTQGRSRSELRGGPPATGRRLLFAGANIHVIRAFSRYFLGQGAGGQGVIMQVLGVDSTQANGGLKLRFWFPASLGAPGKVVCEAVADGMDVYGATSDANADTAKAWLKTNVFDPYLAANGLAADTLGFVQWRPSQVDCSAFTTAMPTTAVDTGVFEGSVVFLSLSQPVVATKTAAGTAATLTWNDVGHFSPLTYTVLCVAYSSSPTCAQASVGSPQTVTSSGGVNTGVVQGLSAGTNYFCFAKAVDAEGQTSCSDPALVAIPAAVATGAALELDGANVGCSLGGCTTWTDTSGNGLNAVLEGNGITKVAEYGGVLSCNGVDNLARGANAPEPLLDITGEYSLEVWFAPDSSAAAWKRIFGSKTMEGIWTGNDAGRPVIRFQRVAASGGVPFPAVSFYPSSNGADYPLVKTKWYHVVGTSSGSSAAGWTHKIYVDGVLAGTSTSPAGTSFAASTQAYTICEGYDASRQFWAGDVGIARFYPRAIAATEVLSNYRASLDRFTDYTLSATSLTTAGDVTTWPNTGKRSGLPASATGKQDGTTAGLPQFDASATCVSLNNNRSPSTNIGNFIEMGSMPLNIPTNDGLTVFTYVRFTPSAPLTSYYWPRLFEFAAQTAVAPRDNVGIEALALARRRSHPCHALRSFSRSSSASNRTQGSSSAKFRA